MGYPTDHYWGPMGGLVFGSKALALVGVGDAAYQTWLARGNRPTPAIDLKVPRDALAQNNVARRAVHALFDALNALTNQQKNNIYDALYTPPNPLILSSKGLNQQVCFALYVLQLQVNNPTRLWGATFYTLDNPNFLIQPSFDPTINVPGTTF